MIFIKDKKAWKKFVKEHPNDSVPVTAVYPCYFFIFDALDSGGFLYDVLQSQDLQSMAEKIEKGREF